jgi:hypothetical protein
MHDAGKIITGLVIFLAIVISPVLYQTVKGADVGPPELTLPTGTQQCVTETAYMRVLHMDLLNEWRDDAVRTRSRTYIGLGGKEYDKSLTATCMGCHSSRDEFCDRCHAYVGVKPYCWDCHGDPEESHSSFSWARILGN